MLPRLRTPVGSSDAASGHVGDAGGRVSVRRRRGLGADGVFVGQDPTRAGVSSTTRGCSTRAASSPPQRGAGRDRRLRQVILAKSLYTRSLPFGRRVYVPGDPKGEHTAVANAVGGRAIVLGHGLNTRLNPARRRPPAQRTVG